MEIGRVVKSNSHVEFVCQVWGAGEVDEAPAAEHYGFGALVGGELDEGSSLTRFCTIRSLGRWDRD